MSSAKKTGTSSVSYDPSQLGLFNSNYNTAKQNVGILSSPFTPPFSSPWSPNSNSGTGFGGGMSMGAPNVDGTAASAVAPLNAGIGGAAGILGFDPGTLAGTDLTPYMNPYQNDVINQTIQQQDRARQIANVGNDQRATAAGAFGGSRSGILDAETNRAYDANTGQLIAGLNRDNFSQAQGAAQNDIATRLQAAGLRLNASGQLIDASGQVVSQAAGRQGILNSALGMLPLQSTTNSTETEDPGIAGILGSIGSLFGGLGKAGLNLSDARTKQDIRTIGHDKAGRRWVSFRYRHDPSREHQGVIAQEVQRTDPHAVSARGGLLFVDYSKLGEAA